MCSTISSSSSSSTKTKQTIRFYCFLVCEITKKETQLREADAAGCCGLLQVAAAASGRKQQAEAWQSPKRSFTPTIPLHQRTTANKGVARAVKMSNYFAKMLHNSRVLCCLNSSSRFPHSHHHCTSPFSTAEVVCLVGLLFGPS